jgi:hypothetical protein
MGRLALAALIALTAAFSPATARAEDPPCNAWEIEYALAAQLRLSDTAMGAGDGVHTIGPGKLVLRFDNVNGQPGGGVKVTLYQMTNRFTVDAHVLGVGTRVVNDTETLATPNACGIAGEGSLRDRAVRWSTPWSGIHTDGHLECSGSMCGRMGAPPSGRSEMHTPTHPVTFKSFELGADRKTFHMDYAVTSQSSSPKQTSRIMLDGQEVRRSCVYVKPCP